MTGFVQTEVARGIEGVMPREPFRCAYTDRLVMAGSAKLHETIRDSSREEKIKFPDTHKRRYPITSVDESSAAAEQE